MQSPKQVHIAASALRQIESKTKRLYQQESPRKKHIKTGTMSSVNPLLHDQSVDASNQSLSIIPEMSPKNRTTLPCNFRAPLFHLVVTNTFCDKDLDAQVILDAYLAPLPPHYAKLI